MAGIKAGGAVAAESDPEGVFEVLGGIEGELSFENGPTKMSEATGNTV